MYILDTDIVIWILREDPKVVSTIGRLGESSTSVSTITIAEVYKNAFPSEIYSIEDLFDHQIIYQISRNTAKEAGLYWNQFHKKLQGLAIADCLVASTAKEYGLTVLTLNIRHFPMTDIKVINPLK